MKTAKDKKEEALYNVQNKQNHQKTAKEKGKISNNLETKDQDVAKAKSNDKGKPSQK